MVSVKIIWLPKLFRTFVTHIVSVNSLLDQFDIYG